MKTFQSTPITFIDQTDSRKLEVYIKNNMPTVQIRNSNSGAFTPNWIEEGGLKIEASVFLDSRIMETEYSTTDIKWYKNDVLITNGINVPEVISGDDDYHRTLTITDKNVLDDNPIITYTCEATYQDIKASTRITFTRVDTGRDGQKGEDGTSVRILGTAKSAELVDDPNYYTIVYDTGAIVAAELGDAYVLKSVGHDLDGHLFVCALLNGGQDGATDYFIDAGQIQGPAGDPAKSIVLIGSSQVFKITKDDKISPSNVTVTAHTVNLTTEQVQSIEWEYRYNASGVWTTITNGASTSDGVISLKDNVATISGSKLSESMMSVVLRATFEDAEDVLTIYKTLDGIDGQKGDTASMAFLTNENTSFPAGADGKTNVLTTFRTNVVAYNGTEKVTPIIGSISDIFGNLPDGMSVVPNKGTAYSKVELTASNAVISDLYSDKDTKNIIDKSKLINGDSFVVGDYLYKYDSVNKSFKSNTVTVDNITYLDRIVVNNEITLLFSVPTGKNFGEDGNAVGEITIPIVHPVSTNLLLSWTKINAGPEGEAGVGINHINVEYGKSEKLDIKPENISWNGDIPTVEDGWYLWTKTTIDYTDPKKQDTVTYTYVKQGTKGDTGTSVENVDIEYIAYDNATTPPNTGWSRAVVATTADKPFLWTKTTFYYGDEKTKTAYSVARYGTDGAKGDKGDQGIQGIQGPKGDQGIQGPAGANGKPSYFHIKYSVNSNGNPMTETPSTYIGTYVDDQADDSTDYLKYTWSRFVGSQGAKGDQGIAGTNGVDGKTSYLHIAYATSADGKAGFSVSDSVSKTYIGQYTDYTEDDSTDPTKYKWTLIKGDKGDQGVQGPKGNDGQQLYTWIKYADTPTSGMSNDPTGKTYIGLAYNKTTATESSTYSDYMWSLIKGETGPTGPKGDNGQQYYTWIKYADNASGANMSDSPTGKLYIGLAYNKTTSTESNVATDYTWALFKGDKGDPGDDAYTVILTNESNVFAGDVSNALASETSTQVLAYLKNVAQTVTIVSVNGVTASTSATATGIAGLTFQCSALTGTSPIITFKCTTAFKTANGTIPIKLKVGNIEFTKVFTYSIAFKGTAGAPSSSYWLVSNASAVQKTSNGDTLFTPATLTFTGKVKTGSGAPTDYAGRWILAYSTDGTTYTNAYTSTANETTASIAASDSYKAVRARMYLAGGTTTLLDEQIIPFVSDGETGAIGAPGDPGVTFQVYSNNGYALSTGVPTILLQTFAYLGDVEITAGATFQWYRHNGTDWVAVSGATNSYFNVSRDDVSFSNNYMCKMQFNGTEYVGVVTIEDKNDENRVFAAKPSNYFAGDLWIVGTDYTPPGYAVGTMLRAEHTNTGYIDSDWVPATKYDDEIKDLRDTVDSYKQYFSVNSTNGLQIGNSSINNDILTTDTVDAANINADSASLESLDIIGKYSGSTMLQAPVINLGKFSIVIESNGSLSIVANT